MTLMSKPEKPRLKALRPKPASTLIIVDSKTSPARVLLGRRRADQVFLPGKFVFPGGRLEADDRRMTSKSELAPQDIETLCLSVSKQPAERLARALAMAAIRETHEETGLIIGTKLESPADLDRYPAAWHPFLKTGHEPNLAAISIFARAVTPPGRPRRYDTRFFFTDASSIAAREDWTDGELEALEWFTIADAETLDLPTITSAVLRDLEAHLTGPNHREKPNKIPFYRHRRGHFERILLQRPTYTP